VRRGRSNYRGAKMHEDDKPLAIASFASFMCLAFFQPLLIYDGWNYGFDLGSWPLAACIYDATLIPIFLLCSLSCGYAPSQP